MDKAPDFDQVDTMIDDLSRLQFAVLSDIACGKTDSEICRQRDLSRDDFHQVIYTILEVMEVDQIDSAVSIYSRWIDDYEAKYHNARW